MINGRKSLVSEERAIKISFSHDYYHSNDDGSVGVEGDRSKYQA